jgi:phosphatidylglycerophosphate synthase
MEGSRRPIKSRNTHWAAAVAGALTRSGIKPNQISVASAVFGAGAGAALAATGAGWWWFLVAAVCIQARLLCNLFDGMVAVEGGFRTKSGEIFNELPDRFADAFIFIGAGYAVAVTPWSEVLGWTCAVLAVLTAYARALGASAGAGQHFCGPMAKQHRMAVMTLACVAAAALGVARVTFPLITLALALIAVGCLVTVFRRTARIVRELEAK